MTLDAQNELNMMEGITHGEYIELDYHCPNEDIQILFCHTIKEDGNEVNRSGVKRESIDDCAERDERFNYHDDE